MLFRSCGWLVSLLWAGISAYLVISGSSVETVGLFGTVVDLMPGWWAVGISTLFGVMAIWASWGLSAAPRQGE